MSNAAERLKAKKRPVLVYPICVDDCSELNVKLAEVNDQLNIVKIMKTSEKERASTLRRLEAEKKKVVSKIAESYEELSFQALEPGDFEDLVDEYPPEKKDQENGFPWNRRFPPALAVACLIAPKISETELTEEILPNLSLGERNDMVQQVLNLNTRTPSEDLPKELVPILISRLNSK